MLKLSQAGILNIMFTPIFFLAVLRVMGFTTDPLDMLLRLMIAEGLSLVFSVILLAVLKVKARTPDSIN
jgi:hypothetical protein